MGNISKNTDAEASCARPEDIMNKEYFANWRFAPSRWKSGRPRLVPGCAIWTLDGLIGRPIRAIGPIVFDGKASAKQPKSSPRKRE
jgi:hypothetical protein